MFDEATLLRIADAYERETDMVGSSRPDRDAAEAARLGHVWPDEQAARRCACATSG